MNKLYQSLLLKLFIAVISSFQVLAYSNSITLPSDKLSFDASSLNQSSYIYSDQFLNLDNYKKIVDLRFSAELNDHDAQTKLADYYFDGELVKRDFQLSMKWYLVAASKGSLYAKYMIAIFYKYGIIVPQDLKVALLWEDSAKGHDYESTLKGMKQVANRFLDMNSILFDMKRAKEWLKLAADKGDIDSQNRLAEIYYQNKTNDLEALRWTSLTAANDSAVGQFNLAQMYYYGRMVKQSDDLAFHWMLKSAKGGFKPAQYELGIMFLEGKGVSKNPIVAYAWLMAANNELKKYETVNELAIKATEMIPNELSSKEMEQAAKLSIEFMKYN